MEQEKPLSKLNYRAPSSFETQISCWGPGRPVLSSAGLLWLRGLMMAFVATLRTLPDSILFALCGFRDPICQTLPVLFAAITRVQSRGPENPPSASHGCEAGPSPPGQVHDWLGEVVQWKNRDRAGAVHSITGTLFAKLEGWEGQKGDKVTSRCLFIVETMLKIGAVWNNLHQTQRQEMRRSFVCSSVSGMRREKGLVSKKDFNEATLPPSTSYL